MSFTGTNLAVMLSEAKHLIAVDAKLCRQRHEILRSAQDDDPHE